MTTYLIPEYDSRKSFYKKLSLKKTKKRLYCIAIIQKLQLLIKFQIVVKLLVLIATQP